MKHKLSQNFKKQHANSGFTIIETMIAVALFVVVVMTGMDALLNANRIYGKSEDMRTVLDSLSFITEEMSRNIRTGYNIRCIDYDDPSPFSPSLMATPRSCTTSGAIAFEHAYGDPDNLGDQWVYKVESLDGGSNFNISKSTDSGVTWVQLNPGPDQVLINGASSFSVWGAEAPPGDANQPLVNIRLAGHVVFRGSIISPFSIQTSVSQRLVDSDALEIAGGDTIWFSDDVPPGATAQGQYGDGWNWVSANPTPFHGTSSHISNSSSGTHQHFFYGATTPLTVNTGDTMVTYVYLVPSDVPDEVMLQWHVSADGAMEWEHRAYWGDDVILWGSGNPPAHHYMGPITDIPVGQWFRLEVPASAVNLEGKDVTGMAFTLYGGQAAWDSSGKNP